MMDRQKYDGRGNHALIKALMQTEADIKKTEREKASAEKRIRQIKNSNTYKAAGPFKKLAVKNRTEDISLLKAELEATKKELQETKETLRLAKLDDRSMNSITIRDAIKEVHDDAGLISHIEEAVRQKQQHDENYKEAFTYAGRLFMRTRDDYRHTIYSMLLEGMGIEDVPEYIMREALTDHPLPSRHATSFRASLSMRLRQGQLSGMLPEYILDDKQKAYDFIDALKIRRPWTSKETYQMNNLSLEASTVVKPADGAGARGVYLIHDFNDIIDLKRSRKLSDKEMLLDSMKEDLLTGRVDKDDWLIEEMIMEDKKYKSPASDIKFYCFYGKVGLVLEIKRYPELKYCWWTRDGRRVSTGKYENEPFKGKGVVQKEIEMAETISNQIPAPFIRIDFLRSEDGLVFGEFTPKPGNYEEFDKETDQWLGDLYLEAKGRLEKDLMDQKEFSIIKGLMG